MKIFNFLGKKSSRLDSEQILTNLEEKLLNSDFGVHLTKNIIESLKKIKNIDEQSAKNLLKEKLMSILQNTHPIKNSYLNPNNHNENKDCEVLLIIGTNGSGKTTSSAKIAYFLKNKVIDVALVAADTFRSGAINQLKIWSEKIAVDFFVSNHQKPSAIAYSAIETLASKKDLILIDSAGITPSNANLMAELKKLTNIIKNKHPHNTTLLTLDGTNGINAKEQIKTFSISIEIDGLIITKLDGTSKAGMLFDITDSFKIPTIFVGKGENIDDLELFSAEKFINNIV